MAFLPVQIGEPGFEVASADLGDLRSIFPHIISGRNTEERDRPVGGAAADIDSELAWVRAVAEAAERYATIAFSADDSIVASAKQLGSSAIDLSRIPRCSPREYSDPKCPLRPADLNAPIRWIRGYSLVNERETFVPVVMTHLHVPPTAAERFWLPISTGVAAHTDLAAAILAAACEVIERDALALTWLLRLPLPQIVLPSAAPEPIAQLQRRLEEGRQQCYLFDATTDIGVPTVLLVQLLTGHPTMDVFVTCATAVDSVVAGSKAIKEAATSYRVMSKERPIPESVFDFCDLTNGADYYGRGGHRSDFDFLLKSTQTTSLEAMNSARPIGAHIRSADALKQLIAYFRQREMELVVVDLTTDELRDVGLWVTRVVIPDLVPISFVYRARYLGTPRIYEHAARFGLVDLSEDKINPGPMPFA